MLSEVVPSTAKGVTISQSDKTASLYVKTIPISPVVPVFVVCSNLATLTVSAVALLHSLETNNSDILQVYDVVSSLETISNN